MIAALVSLVALASAPADRVTVTLPMESHVRGTEVFLGEVAEISGDPNVVASVEKISLNGTPIQIDAGGEHACAVFADGNVSCWGRNDHGQVGIPGENMVGDNELPSEVMNINVGSNVEVVAAGLDHTCAILGGGDVYSARQVDSFHSKHRIRQVFYEST